MLKSKLKIFVKEIKKFLLLDFFSDLGTTPLKLDGLAQYVGIC